MDISHKYVLLLILVNLLIFYLLLSLTKRVKTLEEENHGKQT
jgi:hypothetical protein